jgi:hypothetical protein
LDVCCSASKLSQRHTFKPKILFCERRKIDDDDDDDIIIAKEEKQHHHQRRTIACFTGPNDPVLMNFARYHSIIIFF